MTDRPIILLPENSQLNSNTLKRKIEAEGVNARFIEYSEEMSKSVSDDLKNADYVICPIINSSLEETGLLIQRVKKLLCEKTELIIFTEYQPGIRKYAITNYGTSRIITFAKRDTNHIANRILGEIFINDKYSDGSSIIGKTQSIKKLKKDIEIFASKMRTVLITGERGTGKELVAKELHNRSLRKDMSLVTVLCPTLHPDRIEDELFGHTKYSFTDAKKHRDGRFIKAGNGIIFLDEIGDLPLNLQAKLLRAIEYNEIQRVGDDNFIQHNAQIVCATNRDLTHLCKIGKFREDLFDRIKTYNIHLPPLRERVADIPILAHHFINKYNQKQQTSFTVDDRFIDCLFEYDWPGNIREMEYLITIVADVADYENNSETLSATVLREKIDESRIKINHAEPIESHINGIINYSYQKHKQQRDYPYFDKLLKQNPGRIKDAIEISGLSSAQFYHKLSELGLSKNKKTRTNKKAIDKKQ